MINGIKNLPFNKDVETKIVLKQVAKSERALGELKGIIKKVPNEAILLNTLFLQEAKASSEIENIVTTQDEVFRIPTDNVTNPNSKEVQNYNQALLRGFDIIKNENLFLNKHILELQSIIKRNNAGFRTQAGTHLKNSTNEIIYTPPQSKEEIEKLMSNLEKFINDDSLSDINPLIKMAIIHHQFESIHPFYDGNGRVGRIINILYLTLKGLLDIPALYLSGYIIDNKSSYYKLLQKTRATEEWEEWILYMLKGLEETAIQTTKVIQAIIDLMQNYKLIIRGNHPNIYSQDLVNTLFKHPYTKIEFLANDLGCYRQTASKYLDLLVKDGLLEKTKIGKSNYYINYKLCELFINIRSS